MTMYFLYMVIAALMIETVWALVIGVSDKLNKLIKITIGAAIIVGACVILTAGKIDRPDWYSLEQTNAAVHYVIDKKIPQFEPEDVNAPVLAEAYFEAQNKFKVPSLFLVSIGFYESKYLTGALGDGGRSVGIMQVGVQGRRRCAEYCGEMKTEHQQILCGGCWLRENIDWCGSLESGLTGYACGRCKSHYARTKNAVSRRFKLWYDLHDEIVKTKE